MPFWAKDLKIGYRMINARSETAASNNAFRGAMRKRRCLILADGFYEWRKEGKERFPVLITLRSGKPFAFAGLWETWKSKDTGEIVRSCTILTTAANGLIESVHDRMPVILTEETEALWLDPVTEEPETLMPLLMPYPPEEMSMREIPTLVNSVENQGPELIAPVSSA